MVKGDGVCWGAVGSDYFFFWGGGNRGSLSAVVLWCFFVSLRGAITTAQQLHRNRNAGYRRSCAGKYPHTYHTAILNLKGLHLRVVEGAA